MIYVHRKLKTTRQGADATDMIMMLMSDQNRMEIFASQSERCQPPLGFNP